MSPGSSEHKPSPDSAVPVCEGRILVVHEDRSTLSQVERILTPEGYQVDLGNSVEEGLTLLKTAAVDLVLVDLGLPDGTGFEALDFFREVNPLVPVVILAPVENPDLATQAIRKGAYEYLCLPADRERLLLTARSAVRMRRFNRESFRLMRSVEEARREGGPLGHSHVFRETMDKAFGLAALATPILMIGEPGTGKNLIAKAIHDASPIADKPFVSLHASNVSALDLESFAKMSDPGEIDSGGTLYLEDIEELPPKLRGQLAEILEGIHGPGSEGADPESRFICSTKSELSEHVWEGRFDERLFNLLEAGNIKIPPLRARREDIPLLATWFLEQAAGDEHHKGLSLDALMLLEVLPWPGNLRELRQAVERAWVLSEGEAVKREHLVGPGGSVKVADLSATMLEDSWLARKLAGIPPTEADVLPFEEEERRILDRALKATEGNVTKAAQLLRIGRATLYRKIHQYDLRDPKQGPERGVDGGGPPA